MTDGQIIVYAEVDSHGSKSILLAPGHTLVTSTAFLPWVPFPATAARPFQVGSAEPLMIKTFLGRSFLRKDLPRFSDLGLVSVLELSFSVECWERVLNEINASDVRTRLSGEGWPAYQAALAAASFVNTSNVGLAYTDLDRGETFDAPPAAAVSPRPEAPRRRGQGQAIGPEPMAAPPPPAPPMPGPPELLLLSLTTLNILEEPDSTLPLGALCYLAGQLGDCRTRALRLVASGGVRVAAEVLTANVVNFVGGSASMSHATLATHLPGLLRAAEEAIAFAPNFDLTNQAALRAEARDAFRYLLGSPDERRAVEARRITFALRRVSATTRE